MTFSLGVHDIIRTEVILCDMRVSLGPQLLRSFEVWGEGVERSDDVEG